MKQSRYFSGIPLLLLQSSVCWQFDLWLLWLFQIHLIVLQTSSLSLVFLLLANGITQSPKLNTGSWSSISLTRNLFSSWKEETMCLSFLDPLIIIPVPQIIRVGIHVLCLVIQSCPTLCDPMDSSPPGSSVHGDSFGKNTGVAYHALLQVLFPTQGLKPGLLHYRQILYCLNHQGSPRILE